MTETMTALTLGVLEAIAENASRLRYVRIDEARLAEVCAGIGPGDLKLPAWDFPVFYRRDPDALAGQILLFDAINFCYWGEPKWEVEFGGEWWDGSMAMLASIHRALDEGLPILDANYLARLPAADLAHILRGRGQLHLMAERLAIWQEVGQVLAAELGGRNRNGEQKTSGPAGLT